MTHIPGHTEIEPVGSPRRKCIDAGGTWDEATQTCDMKKEFTREVPKEKDTRTRIERDEFGNIISTTLEPIRPITKEERLEVGLAGITEVGAREALAGKQRAGEITVEREKLIAEQTPEILPLQPPIDPGLGGDPQAIGGELFPIIGPLGTLSKKVLGPALADVLGLPLEDAVFEIGKLPRVELRTLALTEIANRELDRGLSDNEKVGEFVEALGLGDLTNFAAEKPSENVQTVLKGIRILKSDATDVETKVIRGTLTQALAKDRLDVLEEELIRASFRMQNLIRSSPELKFDSDGVNFIEQKVLQANRRIFDARLGILSGKITDPTDLQIAMDLQATTQRAIAEETFEI